MRWGTRRFRGVALLALALLACSSSPPLEESDATTAGPSVDGDPAPHDDANGAPAKDATPDAQTLGDGGGGRADGAHRGGDATDASAPPDAEGSDASAARDADAGCDCGEVSCLCRHTLPGCVDSLATSLAAEDLDRSSEACGIVIGLDDSCEAPIQIRWSQFENQLVEWFDRDSGELIGVCSGGYVADLGHCAEDTWEMGDAVCAGTTPAPACTPCDLNCGEDTFNYFWPDVPYRTCPPLGGDR